MGHKPSNIFQSDRPESGGADHDQEREHSGMLEREKQKFAEASRKKSAGQGRRGRSAKSPGSAAEEARGHGKESEDR